MAQDSELQLLRNQLSKMELQLKGAARRSTVGMLILVFVTVSSVIYAYMKQVDAARSAVEATRMESMALESARDAALSRDARMAAEDAQHQLQAELDKCRQGKK